MLIATGSIARECHAQEPLINLLCDYGADPNRAIEPSALNGELKAVRILITRGARPTLPIAAALGKMDNVRQLLSKSNPRDRHWALALATQFDRLEVVRLLLDAGEDPNRYNPTGGHSHSMPLHQAAGYGSLELVRLLVERGAWLDVKDILWRGTPADWAHHEGRTEIESYLRGQKANPWQR